MARVDWTVLYNNQDTNFAFEVYHNKVTEIYNVAFPKVKIKSMYYVRKTLANIWTKEVNQNKK